MLLIKFTPCIQANFSAADADTASNSGAPAAGETTGKPRSTQQRKPPSRITTHCEAGEATWCQFTHCCARCEGTAVISELPHERSRLPAEGPVVASRHLQGALDKTGGLVPVPDLDEDDSAPPHQVMHQLRLEALYAVCKLHIVH